MTSIVLVHGAWGGSYGFRLLRPLLTAAGHDVFSPSLTGIGERSHLSGEHVDLSLHIKDLTNTIFYEDLDDILLLGFSYGGMVVTGALDHIGDKVQHLVYLDALLPADGQSAASFLGAAGEALLSRADDDWKVPPIPRELDTPEATAWSNERRSPQPRGTLVEPVQLSKPLEEWDFTRTYIKASADPGEADDSAFWTTARALESSPAWNYHEVATNHMVPSMRPQELAAILLDIAAS